MPRTARQRPSFRGDLRKSRQTPAIAHGTAAHSSDLPAWIWACRTNAASSYNRLISCESRGVSRTTRITRHHQGAGCVGPTETAIPAPRPISSAASSSGAAARRTLTFSARSSRSSPMPESSTRNAEAGTANFDMPRNRLNPGAQS